MFTKSASSLWPSRVIKTLGNESLVMGTIPVPPECASVTGVGKEVSGWDLQKTKRGGLVQKVLLNTFNPNITVFGRKGFLTLAIGNQSNAFRPVGPRVVVPVIGDVVEVGRKRKVITLRNGVGLVVVASRATKRHAHRKLGSGVHDVCDLVGFGLGAIGGLIVPDAQPKKAGPQL